MKHTIIVSIVNETGTVTLATNIGENIFSDLERIEPPGPAELSPGTTFNDVVTILRKREYRRHRLIDQVHRMGMQLADRLEDEEGWHGVERQETIREQRREHKKGKE